MATINNRKMIQCVHDHGLTICKHADPTEGAREGLTVAEAEAVYAEDPSLLYVEASDERLEALEQSAGQAGDLRQVGLCKLALHGAIDFGRHANLADEREWLSQWTRVSAREECVDVMIDAAARR